MNQSICTVDGCPVPVGEKGARGWCPKHYQRFLNTGDPQGRKCEGCGTYLAAVFGDQVRKRRYCSDSCKPLCPVEGCEESVRKAGWCASHYSQWQVKGEVHPFQYTWAQIGSKCLVCGAECTEYGFRSVCSAPCRAIHHRFPDRPKQIACLTCGETVSLISRDANGRLRTARTLQCTDCRRRYRRPMLSAAQLASRDGTTCKLCDRTVDLGLAWPHRMSASVDHVRPLARGGSEDPSNLALTHLTCNTSKQARLIK